MDQGMDGAAVTGCAEPMPDFSLSKRVSGENSGDGEISASMTGLFPYGCYGLTPGWTSGPWPATGGGSPSNRMALR